MASYVLKGYSTPEGVNNRASVKEIQAQIGVKADGIWGPKTQAAYEQHQQRQAYEAQINQIRSMISGAGSFSVPSVNRAAIRTEIEEALRPSYDAAIEARKRQTLVNRNEIDVDAASRGLGRSTWVTDAKTRQMDSEADDINTYESQYAASLANAVNEAAAAQQGYAIQAASAQASAQAQAAGLAMQLMQMQQQYAPQYPGAGSSRGGGGGGGGQLSLPDANAIVNAVYKSEGAKAAAAETKKLRNNNAVSNNGAASSGLGAYYGGSADRWAKYTQSMINRK